MSDIAFHFDFTGLIVWAEIVAFMLVFIGAWVRRWSKAWGAFFVALAVTLMIAAPFAVLLG